MTEAYRRLRELGFAIANGIGQHPNDRELSFYVASPSGFEIELGWNPIVVTDEASRGSPATTTASACGGTSPRA